MVPRKGLEQHCKCWRNLLRGAILVQSLMVSSVVLSAVIRAQIEDCKYTHKTLANKFCAYIIELMEGNNANQPRLGNQG